MNIKLACTIALFAGCGGLNLDEQGPGNNDTGGISLDALDIAVSPDGRYIIASHTDHLTIERADSCSERTIQMADPERLAFSNDGNSIYVTSQGLSSNLIAIDLNSGLTRFVHPLLENNFRWEGDSIVPTPDILPTSDGNIVLAYSKNIELISATSGATILVHDTENAISDATLSVDGKFALLTLQHSFFITNPTTIIERVALATGITKSISVPNCDSKLAQSPDGRYGFLSPDGCEVDPISVIDLQNGVFLRNLPGFGPVGIGAGATAVAYVDSANFNSALAPTGTQTPDPRRGRYDLMLLDTTQLSWRMVPIGNSLPRYALTPDGNSVIIDSDDLNPGPLRIVNIASGIETTVSGDDVTLNNFVITPDSHEIYLIAEQLYALDIAGARVQPVSLPYTPVSINISLDGSKLYIRDTSNLIHELDPVSKITGCTSRLL